MKKIKFIPLILIAIALITTSCAIDDDDAIIPQEIITKTVSLADSEIIVPASATPYDIEVMVDQVFGSDALVEYTMNGADGGSTIYYGSTSGAIPVDVSEEGSSITITLTNVSVLNKPNFVKAVVDEDNKTIKILVLTLPDADPDALQVVMTWDNAAENDFDLLITEDPAPVVGGFFGNTVENLEISQSVTPLEDVSFSNSFYADDTYNIVVLEFSSVSDANATVVIVHPDGTIETYSDLIPNGSGYNYFVQFDKVGDVYTTRKVPTESIDLN